MPQDSTVIIHHDSYSQEDTYDKSDSLKTGDTIWLNETHSNFALVDSPAPSHNNFPDIIYEPVQLSEFERQRQEYSDRALPYTLLLLAGLWFLIRLIHGKSKGYTILRGWDGKGRYYYDNQDYEEQVETVDDTTKEDCLTYEGSQLNFTKAQLISILNKRSPFFYALIPPQKDKFIERLHKFMAGKTFKIHAQSGYKEMPVLISGAAIQLSFGLESYLLNDFSYIHIFPEEFLGVHPTLRFLEGNVSGNCINISWKHFLEGFALPSDGQNVGLHEMAHAYYYQNFECDQCDKQFVNNFSSFDRYGNKVFEQEKLPGNDLFSEYALRNFQEFWAESVEIFFEEPVQLKTFYPELYDAMRSLLNQDPAKNS